VRELCKVVFELINKSSLAKDFGLKDQIWRASGSVMDNIAEGVRPLPYLYRRQCYTHGKYRVSSTSRLTIHGSPWVRMNQEPNR